MDQLAEDVAALMREVAAREIMPRFRALADHEIEEKEKGELVTVADRASEAWLTPRLERLRAGSHTLGEEAVATDASLMSRLGNDVPLWTIDPVDGTANFVAGRETFGVMLSLIEKGEVTRGWIYLPVTDELGFALAACVLGLRRKTARCRARTRRHIGTRRELLCALHARRLEECYRHPCGRNRTHVIFSLFCGRLHQCRARKT